MVDTALLGQVRQLSAAERVELIGAVWESLEPEEIPVSEAEKTLLDTRLKDREENPHDQSLWPEARDRIRRRLS